VSQVYGLAGCAAGRAYGLVRVRAGRCAAGRAYRLVQARVNGQLAFETFLAATGEPNGLLVLTLHGDPGGTRISVMTRFAPASLRGFGRALPDVVRVLAEALSLQEGGGHR
jgi:hypothetical protein